MERRTKEGDGLVGQNCRVGLGDSSWEIPEPAPKQGVRTCLEGSQRAEGPLRSGSSSDASSGL